MVTVALGAGSVTAVASLLLALGFAKLPYRAPERLVAVWERGNPGGQLQAISGPDMADMAVGANAALEVLAPLVPQELMLSDWAGASPISTCSVSAAGLATLGLVPVLGRAPNSSDAPYSASSLAPAWISHHLWRTRYGSNPAIVGRSLGIGLVGDLDHYRIVGVLPEKATIPFPFATGECDFWNVLRDMSHRPRAAPGLFGVGRLRQGSDIGAARAALRTVTDRLGRTYAFDRNKVPVVESLQEIANGPARRTMALLALGIMLVFLVACANLAILMIAEGARRKGELAIRTALGATRWRIWAEVAGEKCLSTTAGLAAGWGLALVLIRALTTLLPAAGLGEPMLQVPALNPVVLSAFVSFALAAALLWSALVVSAASGRSGPARALAGLGAGAHTADHASGRWRLLLLASQAAIAVCLLASAALAARAYTTRSAAQLGPEPRQTFLLDVAPKPGYSSSDAENAFYKRQVASRLAHIPGVQQVALADHLPPGGTPASFVLRGDPAGSVRTTTPALAISDGFFRVLGIPVLYGRGIEESDARPGARSVVVINAAMAAQNWPNPQDAVGAEMAFGSKFDKPSLIVGVVGNFTGFWLQQAVPEVFIPEYLSDDTAWQSATVILRTNVPPGTVAGLARHALADMPIPTELSNVRSMHDAWKATVTRPWARMLGMLLLAILGLALSLQGIFAVAAADSVARMRELAVRAVLGAPTGKLVWTASRSTALAVLAGGAGGVAAARLLQPVLAQWLGPAATWSSGPVLIAGACLVVAATAGCYLPARSAVRVNPTDVLRQL